jgi:hypothetical protein
VVLSRALLFSEPLDEQQQDMKTVQHPCFLPVKLTGGINIQK